MKKEVQQILDKLRKKNPTKLSILIDYHRNNDYVGYCRGLGNLIVISFNRKLWKSLSEYQKKKAVVHEYCHTISYENGKKMTHNNYWKRLMRKFGYKPSIGMRIYD